MPPHPSATPGPSTLLDLYRTMARARAFELLLLDLWEDGQISGELHLGTGEEAVAAGVISTLHADDALALDHRPTPWLLLHGVDPVAMVREMLGLPDGLGGGNGGHMHLLAADRCSASSGIVGAAAPLGCGFALAAARLRPGSVAVATFGDGAMNQGMVMEALNLAAVWRLPVLFVCKDNDWAITTESSAVTAGDLTERAASFDLSVREVDGGDPMAVREAAAELVGAAREGTGPGFLRARTPRLDSHMAGFIMDRLAGNPLSDGGLVRSVVAQSLAPGGSLREKVGGLGVIGRRLARARGDHRDNREDPLRRVRASLDPAEAGRIEAEVARELAGIREAALAPAGSAS